MKFDVLLVSSNAAELAALGRMLDEDIFRWVKAESYRRAVTLLCWESFDVIVCDEYVADGSWKDIVGQIADKPQSPAVIVLTTGIEGRDRELALESGAYELLAKPVDTPTLNNHLYGACSLACTGTAAAAAGGQS